MLSRRHAAILQSVNSLKIIIFTLTPIVLLTSCSIPGINHPPKPQSKEVIFTDQDMWVQDQIAKDYSFTVKGFEDELSLSFLGNGNGCKVTHEKDFSFEHVTCTIVNNFSTNGHYVGKSLLPYPVHFNICAIRVWDKLFIPVFWTLEGIYNKGSGNDFPSKGFTMELDLINQDLKTKTDKYGKTTTNISKSTLIAKQQFGIATSDFKKIPYTADFDKNALNTLSDGSKFPASWNSCNGFGTEKVTLESYDSLPEPIN
jgi:hypothetical protein